MSRVQLLAFVFVAAAFPISTASAQFLYLKPDPSANGTFSLHFQATPWTDPATAKPLQGVNAVTVVTEGDKRTQVAVELGDKSASVKSAADTLFASLDYGVSNRGERHLVLLRYHAKTQPIGGVAVVLPLEVTSKAVAGGVAFVAMANGKPLGNTTVTIYEPESTEPRTVTTDADGLTPTYSKNGRYAARVGRFEKATGELEGRAYTGIWEYSTLVTEMK